MTDPSIHTTSAHGAKGSRKSLYLIFLLLLYCIVVFVYKLKGIGLLVKTGKNMKYDHSNVTQPQDYGCRVPQLTPFPASAQRFFKKTPPQINCEKKTPLLFKSTFQSSIIPAEKYDYFQRNRFASCCYRTVERNHSSSNPDMTEIVSSKCFPLSFKNSTIIPEGHEFIAIYCKMKGKNTKEKMVDIHSFVHLKPRNLRRYASSKDEKQRKYNVVIFGVDSMSRMNFLRTMSQSHAFLKNEMGAVDMLAYSKVGANTFPNILPMLTSKTPQEIRSRCIKGKKLKDCPFIWKEFSREGYYTAYSEDSNRMSTFIPGFRKQPTDYYTIPIIHWADKHILEKGCFGPRLTFQFLLDHMEKFVQKMGECKNNYFHFTWANELIHRSSNLNNGLAGDPHLLKSLEWLKQSGHLNDTIFILMSDHGFRYSSHFRKTIQGQLEDRLPFVYFVLPESFKAKYKRAYKNLIGNRDKLMTTFDLHQTLKDILHLKTIEENSLTNREAYLTGMGKTLTRGISLFLPIPKFRTCTMAGIPLNYCTCNFIAVTNLTSPEVKNVTMVGVTYINAILDGVVQCSQLQLSDVTMAQHTLNKQFEAYLVNFETKPGGGQFEALVGRRLEEGERWSVQGKVDRTNSYHDQSRCVEGDQLKSYCYCMTSSNQRTRI